MDTSYWDRPEGIRRLQAVQHICACWTGLPLRISTRDPVAAYHNAIQENHAPSSDIQSFVEFVKCSVPYRVDDFSENAVSRMISESDSWGLFRGGDRDLLATYDLREQRFREALWLTYPSNSSPFQQELKTYPRVKEWHRLRLCADILRHPTGDAADLDCTVATSMPKLVARLSSGHWLVVGPVWRTTPGASAEEYRKRLDQLVANLVLLEPRMQGKAPFLRALVSVQPGYTGTLLVESASLVLETINQIQQMVADSTAAMSQLSWPVMSRLVESLLVLFSRGRDILRMESVSLPLGNRDPKRADTVPAIVLKGKEGLDVVVNDSEILGIERLPISDSYYTEFEKARISYIRNVILETRLHTYRLHHLLQFAALQRHQNFVDAVLTRIVRMVRADFATYYCFDPTARVLRCGSQTIFEVHARTTEFDDLREHVRKLIEALPSLFDVAKCPLARSIVENRVITIDQVDEETRDTVEVEDFLIVPIQHVGRVMGVLFVGAFDPNKFPPVTASILLNAAITTAPYLFQAQHLATQGDLYAAVRDSDGPGFSRNRHARVCQELCRIFSSAGAVLYVRPQATEKYRLIGYYLPEGEEPKREEFTLADNHCFEAHILSRGSREPVVQSAEAEYRFLSSYTLPDTRSIYVPIEVPGTDDDSKHSRAAPLGLLVLFDYLRNKYPIDPTYLTVLTFIASDLAVMLEAARTREEEEDVMGGLMQHELSQYLDGALDSLRDLDSELKFVSRNSMGIETKLTTYASADADAVEESIDSVRAGRERVFDRLRALEANILHTKQFIGVLVSKDRRSALRSRGRNFAIEAILRTTRSQPLSSRTDLAQMIRELAKRERPSGSGIALNLPHRTETLEPVYIYPGLLDRVFGNLFDNARKYSKRGYSVDVHWTVSTAMIKVSIKNTGVPTQSWEKKEFFSYKWRASAHRSSIEGQGLGLFIARAIAQTWGGDVKLASSHVRGNVEDYVFDVHIPYFRTHWNEYEEAVSDD